MNIDWSDSFRRRYPTAKAREAADEVIAQLDVTLPMVDYTDAWLETYRRAGVVEK